MFDGNQFLAMVPTGDHNVDEAVRHSVQLIEQAQREQAVSNLPQKLEFQANLLRMKLNQLSDPQQDTLQQLLSVIQQVKQQHERNPFITGRGMSAVEGGEAED
jgi:hypothetical protein